MTPDQAAILLHPGAYAERPLTSEIAWISVDGLQRVTAREIFEDLYPCLPPIEDKAAVNGVAYGIRRTFTLHGYDHAAGRAVVAMRETGPGAGVQHGTRGQFLMVDMPTRTVVRMPRWHLFKGRTEPGRPIATALRKVFAVTPMQLAHAQLSPRLLTMPYLLAREMARPPPSAQSMPGSRKLDARLTLEHGLVLEATRLLTHGEAAWCLAPALIGEGIQGERGDAGRWYTLRRAPVVEVEAR